MEVTTARISPKDVVDALSRLHTDGQDYNDLMIIETWIADSMDYIVRLEEAVQMYRTIEEAHQMLHKKR